MNNFDVINLVLEKFSIHPIINSPFYGKDGNTIINMVREQLPLRPPDLIYILISFNLGREDRRALMVHLVDRIPDNEINTLINTTRPEWLQDVVDILDRRLNFVQKLNIILKMPSWLSIPPDFVPAGALELYYTKWHAAPRVDFQVHQERDELIFLYTRAPGVSVTGTQPSVRCLILALFRTRDFTTLLQNNQHLLNFNNVTSDFTTNPFTIALLRANSPYDIHRIVELMHQRQVLLNDLQREIFMARSTISPFIVDMVSTKPGYGTRRDILFQSCPTCVIDLIDQLPNVTQDEKRIGLVRSVTPRIYHDGFGDDMIQADVYVYQTHSASEVALTTGQFEQLTHHSKEMLFFKSSRLYLVHKIPTDIRPFIFTRMDYRQIEAYFVKFPDVPPPNDSERRIWLDKVNNPMHIHVWDRWLTSDDIVYGLLQCRTRAAMIQYLQRGSLPRDVLILALIKSDGNLDGLEHVLRVKEFTGDVWNVLFAIKKKTLSLAEFTKWKAQFHPNL